MVSYAWGGKCNPWGGGHLPPCIPPGLNPALSHGVSSALAFCIVQCKKPSSTVAGTQEFIDYRGLLLHTKFEFTCLSGCVIWLRCFGCFVLYM